MGNEVKKDGRGGKRPGAGRAKKEYSKARQQVVVNIEGQYIIDVGGAAKAKEIAELSIKVAAAQITKKKI